MATVDASGPFQWPLIVGIVAVVLVLPLSPRDAEITACLLKAGPDPISIPIQVSSTVLAAEISYGKSQCEIALGFEFLLGFR
jgi:hypothetical protein